MPVIGFTFDKLNVEKNRKALERHKGKEIGVRYNIAIKDVKEEDLELEQKQKILRFDFQFDIIYQPDIGAVNVLGHILYSDKDIKNILKQWDKNKDITDNSLKARLINSIFQKSNLKAISLIQEVGLPLHFPLPKIAPPEQQANKAAEYIA